MDLSTLQIGKLHWSTFIKKKKKKKKTLTGKDKNGFVSVKFRLFEN